MSKYVISLDDVRQTDRERVGSKAAVLGTLREAGFPVPAGLCVTTEAFQLALAPYRAQIHTLIGQHDLREISRATRAADAIAALLADLAVPPAVALALREALLSVTDERAPVAVRSSATAEDRADASFAGQYLTVLGVRAAEAVLDAVSACWRSFFSANALVARARHGAMRADEAMAILIQRMVDAECAGVCFSVDPVRQRRELIVVNAAWGLGVGVVDGVVATDTLVVQRETFEIDSRHVVEKPEQISLAAERGVQRAPVPDERRRAACLPDSWAQRIAQFGVAAEVLLGQPQDMEWAIAQQQVWVLQSRPLTALSAELSKTPHFPVTWDDDAERRSLWLRPPFLRQQLLLPLIVDYWEVRAETGQAAGRFSGSESYRVIKLFNGCIYYRRVYSEMHAGEQRIRRAAMEDLYERLYRQAMTTWGYWGPEVVAATERLRRFDASTADGVQLATHLEDAWGALRRHWEIHWLVWAPPRKALYTAYAAVARVPEAEAKEAIQKLLTGEETAFTRMMDDLYALAQTARAIPSVATSPDVYEQLAARTEAAAFRSQLDAFLSVYGDRVGAGFGSETSLFTPTWREQPSLVLSLIAPYLDPNVEPPAVARARARQARDAQVEALCAACADQEGIAVLQRELAYARRETAVMEEHNHYIDQMADGQLRTAILAAARWLVSRGALATRDEVFWLHHDEIITALRAETPPSFAATIAARQAQHAEWARMEPPPVLGTPDARLDARPALKDEVTTSATADSSRLRGQGASGGRRRGRARVVPNAVLLPNLSPGDMLVAENAGPLWTPLFPILGGLVLDQGALAQHAAATAREYGVPAVIGTQHATRRIRDGAWVTVDGTAGVVELETEC